MKLNHLNLVVDDVAGVSRLFAECFGFSVRPAHPSGAIAILDGSDGMILVLMSAAFNRGDAAISYPAAFHIGFMQESRVEVDALHRKLVAAAAGEVPQPGRIRDSYGFYFHFDKLMLEIGVYETS